MCWATHPFLVLNYVVLTDCCFILCFQVIPISSRACLVTIKLRIVKVLDFGGIYLVLWIERLNVLLQGKLLCCLTGMISLELSCFDGIFGSIVLRPNILYSRLYSNQNYITKTWVFNLFPVYFSYACLIEASKQRLTSCCNASICCDNVVVLDYLSVDSIDTSNFDIAPKKKKKNQIVLV